MPANMRKQTMNKGNWRFPLFIRDTISIIAVTLFLFVLSEIALRLMFAPPNALQKIPHERYLFTLRPNSTVNEQLSSENGGNLVTSKTNSWGFRGKDIQIKTNEIRIMVYGDSNIQASFSTLDNTYAEQLERNLEENSKKEFEVINAGVNGFGPDQISLRIDEEIDYWKPDLIIVNVFADNDFGDIFRNKLFRLDDDGSIYYSPYEYDIFDRIQITMRRLYIFLAAKKISSYFLRELMENETELDSLFRRVDEEYESYLNDPENARSGGDHYDLDIALDPRSETSRLKIRLMKGILESIKTNVAKRDLKLLFMIQPSVKDISTNAELNYRVLENISEQYHRKNLVAAVEKIFNGMNANFVSLFDTFLSNEKSQYYYVLNNNHWNDNGQKLAAKLVSEYILTHFDFP